MYRKRLVPAEAEVSPKAKRQEVCVGHAATAVEPAASRPVKQEQQGLLQRLFGIGFLSDRGRARLQEKQTAVSPLAYSASQSGDVPEYAIQCRVMNSAAGKAMQAMDSLRDVLHGLSDCSPGTVTALSNTSKLSFPEIAVVGQESTGKSSVLERITMLPLFPRGSDITTRMPVRLKLRHIGTTAALDELCNALKLPSDPDAVYVRACMIDRHTEVVQGDSTEFEVIRRKDDYLLSGVLTDRIKTLMKAAATAPDGSNLGICDRWIMELELRSCQLPNLVVVDLPGIVGSPVAGEPWDLPERTQRLVSEYTQKEDCLVLIVCEGTSPSVRNSKAFDVVLGASSMGTVGDNQKADKAIGVLTKCDGCATGSQLERLRTRVYGTARDTPYLKFGYVAVVNRDSHDEQMKGPIPLECAAQAEQAWFQRHLPGLLEGGKAGGTRLVERLVEMLTGYVRMTWAPKALATLGAIQGNLQAELESLGQSVPTEPEHQVLLARTALKSMISAVQTTFGDRSEQERSCASKKPAPFLSRVTSLSMKVFFGVIAAECPRVTERLCRAKLDAVMDSVTHDAVDPEHSQVGTAAASSRFIGNSMVEMTMSRLEDEAMRALDRMAGGALDDEGVPQLWRLIQDALQASYQASDPVLKLQRFPRLKHTLSQAIQRLFSVRMRSTKAVLHRRLQLASDKVVLAWLRPRTVSGRSANQLLLDETTVLVHQIAGLIFHHAYATLQHVLFHPPFSDPVAMADTLISETGVSSLLQEDDETTKKRSKLNKGINEVIYARQTVIELEVSSTTA